MPKKKVKYDLGFIDVEVKQLVKADWNYKEEDIDKAEKLNNNIKRNGQVENIIIRELKTGFFEVVNGNHRLDAFSELKLDKVHCFNVGKISDAHAQRLAIETNETKFPTDNIKLAKVIGEISKEFNMDELLLTMPYNEEELEDMKKLLEFDWEQFEGQGEENQEDSDDKDNTVTCPDCGCNFTP